MLQALHETSDEAHDRLAVPECRRVAALGQSLNVACHQAALERREAGEELASGPVPSSPGRTHVVHHDTKGRDMRRARVLQISQRAAQS